MPSGSGVLVRPRCQHSANEGPEVAPPAIPLGFAEGEVARGGYGDILVRRGDKMGAVVRKQDGCCSGKPEVCAMEDRYCSPALLQNTLWK